MELEGYKTMYDDIHKILSNEKLIEVDEAFEKGRAYKYEYGSILVPDIGRELTFITAIPNLGEKPKKVETWFLNLLQTIKAIEQNGIEEVIERLVNEQVEDSRAHKKQVLITRYKNQRTVKKILSDLFEKENWVIPYYIYWDKKDTETLYAVLDIKDGLSNFSVIVNQNLAKQINNILEEHEFKNFRYHTVVNMTKREGTIWR